jgi:hypothetical protein
MKIDWSTYNKTRGRGQKEKVRKGG